jgi:hypothetical protein
MKESRKEKQELFDLDTLLHPARAFSHPMDVVRDADLTLNEKRAILASWASDACALEAASDLRVSTSGNVVRWDDIMDALRALDQEGFGKSLPHYKRVLAKTGKGLLGARLGRRRNDNDQGAPLN